MRPVGRHEYEVRIAGPADRSAVVELCRATLGWADGRVDEEFFAWKHDLNHFGTSPAWLAVADGAVVGVRVFMRWRFRDTDGATLSAVRAVDTATDPAWQGRGIFNRLTLGALPDLRADGVDFVFNTPNEKSRPGYLKMGWAPVGRVPVSVRPTGREGLRRLAGARTAADRWSRPCSVGLDPAEAFADDDEVERLLAAVPTPGRIATDRSVGYLRWRYSFAPLAYRVVPVGDRISDGVVVFRVRARGSAVEGTLCELLLPPGRPSPDWASLARDTGADFLLRAGTEFRSGFVPAPRIGPILTWKPLNRQGVPSLRDLAPTMGDVELF